MSQKKSEKFWPNCLKLGLSKTQYIVYHSLDSILQISIDIAILLAAQKPLISPQHPPTSNPLKNIEVLDMIRGVI
jgi:hypothetical protein